MSDFKPGEMLEITLLARFGEYVADGAAIVVHHEYRTNADNNTTYVSKTGLRLGHNLTITRVAPANWPPQPGDVWHNRDGDPFVHILSTYDHGDGDITEKPGLVAVFGGEFSTPEAVLADGSPLTLVHRETGKGTEPTYEQSWRQACGDLDCTWPNCAHDAHKRVM